MGSSEVVWYRFYQGRGSSVTQREDNPSQQDFWNLDSVKSSLTEPTFLLSFLTFHFPSPQILHPFSTHDDTILPTYPIKLFLLPIIYDDAYPPSSSRPWSTTRATAVRGVQPQPAAARGIQYTASAGRAGGRGGGPRRGGEREETLRKVRMYSMA